MSRIEVRDKRQPGHFWADNEVYTKYGPTIGIDGFAVYMALCQYANEASQAWPSISTLAKQLDAAPNTIRKALGKLEDAGLISVTERPRDTEHKVAQTNVYTLLKVDKDVGTSPDAVPHDMKHGVLHDVKGGTSPDEVGVLHDVKRNNNHKNKTQGISGGARAREDKTPPPLDPIITGLIKAGLTPQQAERDAPLQEFAPAILAALLEWSKELRSRGVNPGKVLQGYTRIGMLPDDLPLPIEASPPAPELVYDKSSNTMRPVDPEAYARYQATKTQQPQHRIPR